MAKTCVNVSVDADLLQQAHELSIDVGQAAEQGIRRAIDGTGSQGLRAWIEENRGALRAKAERDRNEGLANEGLRSF